jgi:molybdate transport system substrate-binding protein
MPRPRRAGWRSGLLALVIVAGAGLAPSLAQAQLRVAAASDLALAFRAVGEAFEAKTGQKVTFTFGSTGLLTKQVEQGAPYDVLAAADTSYVDVLTRQGVCDEATKAIYARGRLVVWTRRGAKVGPPKAFADLKDPRYVKVAIANPAHAPYGRMALQALSTTGIAATVQPRLVYGENVLQALQFAQSGNAEVAVVALSLALSSEGDFVPVDAALHAPLDQAMVVCGRDAKRVEQAKAFTAFVNSPEGRSVMRRFGFLRPEELMAEAK